MVIVIMGVSGSGKTTIGNLLAASLQLPFLDADDFHSKENIEKMNSGHPLNDADRMPWLETVSKTLEKAEDNQGCVLACSALKESYRMILQKNVKSKIRYVHLLGNTDLISERLALRSGHFMSKNLLQSQFEILEVPADAHSISVTHHPEIIVKKIIAGLGNNI